jgi:hypothetical protein
MLGTSESQLKPAELQISNERFQEVPTTLVCKSPKIKNKRADSIKHVIRTFFINDFEHPLI